MTIGHVHLTPQLVQAVRDAVDVVSVAEEHTRLERRGNRHVGLCPLHKEKTPSFSVDSAHNLFYCFGCGAGGDAIKLHMMLSGDDFPAAIEGLAERFGVPVSRRQGRGVDSGPDLGPALEAAAEWFAGRLAAHRPTLDYLAARGISSELAADYGLGFAPEGWEGLKGALTGRFSHDQLVAAGLLSPSKRAEGQPYDRFRNRLIFPIRLPSGRVVGFGGRTLGDDDAKYINTRETERFDKKTLLYGLDRAKRAIRDSGRAILVEGYFDVLGTVAAGVEGVVACMGTSLTVPQARLLARYGEEVVIAFDGDAAGQKAYTRALPILLAAGLSVRWAELPPGSDPDTLRQEQGAEALRELLDSAPDAVERELDRKIPAEARNQPQLQARIAPEIGELLQSLPDPILRYSYGRLAAQRLGIPFELMARHLGRGPSRERRSPQEPVPSRGPSRTPGLDQERGFLRLAMSRLAESTDSPVLGDDPPPLEAFWDPSCQKLYATLCDLARVPVEDPLLALRQEVEASDGPVDLLARLLMEALEPQNPPVPADKRREEFEAAATLLRRRWLSQRQRELAQAIRQAQQNGDGSGLERLLQEKSALSRRLHQLPAPTGAVS